MKEAYIEVDVSKQQLHLHTTTGDDLIYSVSTGRNGVGQQNGSGKTPLGWHEVCVRIGEGAPKKTIFKSRVPTGDVFQDDLDIEKDWILTRILWLSGLEPGLNCGGEVDTRQRFIYIHGTPEKNPMGVAQSAGCIRMRDEELINVFDASFIGMRVLIHNGAPSTFS